MLLMTFVSTTKEDEIEIMIADIADTSIRVTSQPLVHGLACVLI